MLKMRGIRQETALWYHRRSAEAGFKGFLFRSAGSIVGVSSCSDILDPAGVGSLDINHNVSAPAHRKNVRPTCFDVWIRAARTCGTFVPSVWVGLRKKQRHLLEI
ncbi:hypothetical protein XENOCAPTIV_004221 [Xenoophorus captivus]|uniref:Uncharacterized protein n=1 Tax=Xenoophorus captivus TaxID=1517983 RepID=A0ABV0QCN7_9TELE